MHPSECIQRGRRAGAVVRTSGGDDEPLEALGRLRGGHSAERLSVCVEGHQRNDGKGGHTADRLDRNDELLEVTPTSLRLRKKALVARRRF